MNVLITGGAGYIGSHCNKYFFQKGINTVIVDNLIFGHEQAVRWGTFIKGDFGDTALITSVLNEYNIDAVLHFAAFADVADSVAQPSKYYENNVTKFLQLLDCMVKCDVRHIVFSSSAATFGEPVYVPINEMHPQNPINPYGETKLIGEKILRDYDMAYGVKSISMRYFNAAGADIDNEIGESHEPEHHLIPLICKTALGYKEILSIYGSDYKTKDGTCIRDYIHVTDLAAAHYLGLQLLLFNNKSEEFNLGNNEGFSVKEIVEVSQVIINQNINYVYAARRSGDPAILVASNEKAKKILKWQPHVSDLQTILSTAWNWEQNKTY